MKYLLNYHRHSEDGGYELLNIQRSKKNVSLDAFAYEPGLSSSSDGMVNEHGGASFSFSAEEFLDALVELQLEGYCSREGDAFRLSMSPSSIELTTPGPVVGPEPRAYLTEERQALMMLDACDAVGGATGSARTGLQLPRADVHRAFLMAVRLKPSFVIDISERGLERAVTALLMESHVGGIRLKRISDSQDSWLVSTPDDSHAPMLLTLVSGAESQVGLNIVDRINGIRDRKSAPKAVVVTRSYFSSDVTRHYGGLSERMELVDYDRLIGMLTDAGWTSAAPGFLTCPVAKRAKHSTFISYSHTTKKFAVWLYNQLHGWGYDCVLDDVSLHPGGVILSAIQQAIEGADTVLLCCSKEALESEWVEFEIGVAVREEKRRGKTILVPLDLDGSLREKSAPDELSKRLSIDFRKWSASEDSGQALRKVRDALETCFHGDRNDRGLP